MQSLTDTGYWDRTWAGRPAPDALDPRASGLNGTFARYWHAFFSRALRSMQIQPGDKLLEAGCGGSIFLPYFAKEHGLVAEGIDNSPEACDLSQAIAKRCGISAAIHTADVLDPPAALRRRYKVVFSLGLAEHFTPTSSIINSLAAFLQDGGYMITVVPNMQGLVGALQSVIDPAVYRLHVPLSPAALADAHRACELTVRDAAFAMTANFSVLNFNGPNSRISPMPGLRLASWTSKIIWTLERLGLPEIPNRWTSPYLFVLAQRAASTVASVPSR